MKNSDQKRSNGTGRILPLAACLLLGAGLGYLLPRPSPDAGSPEIPCSGTSKPSVPKPNTRPGGGVPRRVAGNPGNPSISPADGSEWALAPLRLIEELSVRGGRRSPGQELFDRNDRVVELIGISGWEKAGIQASWDAVRADLRSLQAGMAVVEDREDGSVRITVPAMAGQKDTLRHDFGNAVKELLGDDRGGVFLAVKQIDRVFAPEEGGTTYEVKVEAVGDGSWRYHMSQQGAGGRKVWVSEKVTDEIRHLTDAMGIFPHVEQ